MIGTAYTERGEGSPRRESAPRRGRVRAVEPDSDDLHRGFDRPLSGTSCVHLPDKILYRRLVPGHEASVILVYSQLDRNTPIRTPIYSHSSKSKRIEHRLSFPTLHPDISLTAVPLAGLDGVPKWIDTSIQTT